MSIDPTGTFRIGDLVLYKNNQLIAFNKPAGIPVQADKTGDKALINLAEIYSQSKLHLIHRLDRPTSGVVLFAKTQGAMAALSEQFRQRTVRKIYLAVVGEMPPAPEGNLVHFIKKQDRQNRAIAFDTEQPDSERAELHYRLMGSSDNYHLLEVEIITGRHHQIRAQLAAIGCPIKGDVKYGFRRGNRDRSIHLHSWQLQFQHPVSGETERIIAPLPDDPVWHFFDEKLNP